MWFYSKGSERFGPVPLEELVAEMTAGRVQDHDLLWREGMESWVPASEVLEVQRAFADARFSQAIPAGAMTPAMAVAAPTNPMAITSMILGICGIVLSLVILIGILTGLPAVICGHIARRQIRESQHPMGGDGMALAGLITGYLSIIFTGAGVAFLIFFWRMLVQATGSGYP